MSEWVSSGAVIVSDFGDSYSIYRACELVHLETFAAQREGRVVTVPRKSTPSLIVKPLRRRKGSSRNSEEAWNDISCVANITAMQTGLISCYWEAPEMSEDN